MGQPGGSVDLGCVQSSITGVTHAAVVASGLDEGWLV